MKARILSLALLAVGCAPPMLDPRPARDGVVVGELFERSWHPAAAARGVVVIHHGLKSHCEHYDEIAERLVRRGYAVYAYDMRGHGRSAGSRATLDDFGDLVADLDRFVERVRAREVGRSVFVMGHSVGGAVVTLYALTRRPAIDGLIVLAPALRIDRLPFEAAVTPIAAVVAPNAPLVDVPDEDFSRDPAVVAELAHDPLVYHPPAPARTAGALLEALRTIWAHAGELDVPLLALHGTGDRATDPRGTVELARRAGGRDKTLLLYRGLAHDLVREPERSQVMADIERWLDGHGRPR